MGNFMGELFTRYFKSKAISSFVGIVETYLGKSPYGFCFVDYDGIVKYANKKVEDIIGYSADEFVGRNMRDVNLFASWDMQRIIDESTKKRDTDDRSLMFDSKIKKKDGHDLWIYLTIIPIEQKKSAKLIGAIIFVYDQTEFKKMEADLKFSNAAFKSIREGTIICDIDFKILYLNEAAERIYGINPQEMIGRTLFDVIKIIPPLLDRIKQEYADYDIKGIAHFEHFVETQRGQICTDVVLQNINDDDGKAIAKLAIITDITERKKNEEDLYFADTALKSVKEWIVITEKDFTIIDWNESCEDLMGYRSCEVKGHSLYEYIELIEPSLSHILEASKALNNKDFKNISNFECLLKVKDRVLWVEIFPQIIRNNNGEIIAILSIVTDITERKKNEEKLRFSNAAFKSIKESVIAIDDEGIVTHWNQVSERIYGILASEAIGKKIIDIIEVTDDSGSRLEDPLDKLKYNTYLHVEQLHKTRVTEVWVEISMQAIMADGKRYGWVLLCMDITQRKQAEMKLRESEASLVEAQRIAGMGNWYWNLITKDVHWSEEFYRLFGYQPYEISPSRTLLLDMAYPDDREKLYKMMKANIDDGRVDDIIMRFYRKDGELWFANVRTDAVFDDNGRVVKSFGFIQDITKLKKSEEREKQMQMELQNASRLASIGEMASGLAHEINNPLTGVIGFSQLLIGKDVPSDVKDDLKIINHEAQRAARIVSGLLTFAHQRELGRSMIDVNKIIMATLELRQYEMEKDHIRVVTELDSKIPETAADEMQIQQVFLNIVLNAEQAIKSIKSFGTLNIQTEQVDGYIRVSFKDDGPGISSENLPKIFNPFFTTKDVGQGTGLGLSMSHGIVIQHHGKIYTESELGHGAKLTVELPITEMYVSSGNGEMTGDKSSEKTRKRGLIVDDEKTVCIYLSRLLAGWGYDTEVVNNGIDAIERIQNKDYDFILLDIKMPDMNGADVYRCIVELKPAIADKILVVTGDVLERATSAFIEKTHVANIPKPVNTDKLMSSLNKILAIK